MRVTYLVLSCRKLRQRDATKYHIQLCIALFCMLLVFVIGIDQNADSKGCVTVSVLIRYFTLVAVMWMGAEAVLMFQKLVIIFVQITTRYIVILSLVCWCKSLYMAFAKYYLASDFSVLVKVWEPLVYCSLGCAKSLLSPPVVPIMPAVIPATTDLEDVISFTDSGDIDL